MIARRVFRLTAATALAASLTGLGIGTASAAAAASSFPCSDSGTGSTLGIAVNNAEQNLRGDYTVLSGISVSYDTQEPDGSWYAVVSARCGNPR
ncbi:hypothetical protein ABH926_005670 [Catenulispora sp. GP43]|uniref:hypothetical protein n=1 Tax=Catenulispora sp. GP43 TaxID=3156263 RepID=UPI00351678E4